MHRDRLAVVASTVLLAACIFLWRDPSFFSKNVHLPAWTSGLPGPMNAPAYLAFLAMLPAALFSSTPAAAARSILLAVLVAPLPACIAYIKSIFIRVTGADLVLNVVLQLPCAYRGTFAHARDRPCHQQEAY
jgi:hypothetical protein